MILKGPFIHFSFENEATGTYINFDICHRVAMNSEYGLNTEYIFVFENLTNTE